MTKKVPMRTCIGCGESKEKQELIRVIKTPEGEIKLDLTGRANGRGAYLCNKKECLQKAYKRKALHRSFQTEIPKEIYEALEMQLAGEDPGRCDSGK